MPFIGYWLQSFAGGPLGGNRHGGIFPGGLIPGGRIDAGRNLEAVQGFFTEGAASATPVKVGVDTMARVVREFFHP